MIQSRRFHKQYKKNVVKKNSKRGKFFFFKKFNKNKNISQFKRPLFGLKKNLFFFNGMYMTKVLLYHTFALTFKKRWEYFSLIYKRKFNSTLKLRRLSSKQQQHRIKQGILRFYSDLGHFKSCKHMSSVYRYSKVRDPLFLEYLFLLKKNRIFGQKTCFFVVFKLNNYFKKSLSFQFINYFYNNYKNKIYSQNLLLRNWGGVRIGIKFRKAVNKDKLKCAVSYNKNLKKTVLNNFAHFLKFNYLRKQRFFFFSKPYLYFIRRLFNTDKHFFVKNLWKFRYLTLFKKFSIEKQYLFSKKFGLFNINAKKLKGKNILSRFILLKSIIGSYSKVSFYKILLYCKKFMLDLKLRSQNKIKLYGLSAEKRPTNKFLLYNNIIAKLFLSFLKKNRKFKLKSLKSFNRKKKVFSKLKNTIIRHFRIKHKILRIFQFSHKFLNLRFLFRGDSPKAFQYNNPYYVWYKSSKLRFRRRFYRRYFNDLIFLRLLNILNLKQYNRLYKLEFNFIDVKRDLYNKNLRTSKPKAYFLNRFETKNHFNFSHRFANWVEQRFIYRFRKTPFFKKSRSKLWVPYKLRGKKKIYYKKHKRPFYKQIAIFRKLRLCLLHKYRSLVYYDSLFKFNLNKNLEKFPKIQKKDGFLLSPRILYSYNNVSFSHSKRTHLGENKTLKFYSYYYRRVWRLIYELFYFNNYYPHELQKRLLVLRKLVRKFSLRRKKKVILLFVNNLRKISNFKQSKKFYWKYRGKIVYKLNKLIYTNFKKKFKSAFILLNKLDKKKLRLRKKKSSLKNVNLLLKKLNIESVKINRWQFKRFKNLFLRFEYKKFKKFFFKKANFKWLLLKKFVQLSEGLKKRFTVKKTLKKKTKRFLILSKLKSSRIRFITKLLRRLKIRKLKRKLFFQQVKLNQDIKFNFKRIFTKELIELNFYKFQHNFYKSKNKSLYSVFAIAYLLRNKLRYKTQINLFFNNYIKKYAKSSGFQSYYKRFRSVFYYSLYNSLLLKGNNVFFLFQRIKLLNLYHFKSKIRFLSKVKFAALKKNIVFSKSSFVNFLFLVIRIRDNLFFFKKGVFNYIKQLQFIYKNLKKKWWNHRLLNIFSKYNNKIKYKILLKKKKDFKKKILRILFKNFQHHKQRLLFKYRIKKKKVKVIYSRKGLFQYYFVFKNVVIKRLGFYKFKKKRSAKNVLLITKFRKFILLRSLYFKHIFSINQRKKFPLNIYLRRFKKISYRLIFWHALNLNLVKCNVASYFYNMLAFFFNRFTDLNNKWTFNGVLLILNLKRLCLVLKQNSFFLNKIYIKFFSRNFFFNLTFKNFNHYIKYNTLHKYRKPKFLKLILNFYSGSLIKFFSKFSKSTFPTVFIYFVVYNHYFKKFFFNCNLSGNNDFYASLGFFYPYVRIKKNAFFRGHFFFQNNSKSYLYNRMFSFFKKTIKIYKFERFFCRALSYKFFYKRLSSVSLNFKWVKKKLKSSKFNLNFFCSNKFTYNLKTFNLFSWLISFNFISFLFFDFLKSGSFSLRLVPDFIFINIKSLKKSPFNYSKLPGILSYIFCFKPQLYKVKFLRSMKRILRTRRFNIKSLLSLPQRFLSLAKRRNMVLDFGRGFTLLQKFCNYRKFYFLHVLKNSFYNFKLVLGYAIAAIFQPALRHYYIAFDFGLKNIVVMPLVASYTLKPFKRELYLNRARFNFKNLLKVKFKGLFNFILKKNTLKFFQKFGGMARNLRKRRKWRLWYDFFFLKVRIRNVALRIEPLKNYKQRNFLFKNKRLFDYLYAYCFNDDIPKIASSLNIFRLQDIDRRYGLVSNKIWSIFRLSKFFYKTFIYKFTLNTKIGADANYYIINKNYILTFNKYVLKSGFFGVLKPIFNSCLTVLKLRRCLLEKSLMGLELFKLNIFNFFRLLLLLFLIMWIFKYCLVRYLKLTICQSLFF